MNKQSIKKILDYQNYFMHDKKLRYKYELQEKAIRDYNSSMLAVRDEGKEEGIQEGIQKGIQEEKYNIAKQMLSDGMDINLIAKYTKLSIDDITNLKNNHE